MTKKLDASSAVAGALIIPILAGASVLGGFVLQTLWNWFGAPLIGARLSLAESIGLMTLYGFLTFRFSRTPLPSDEKPSAWVSFAKFMAFPMYLVIGYVAHRFIGGQ